MAEAWAVIGVAVNIATIVDHGFKLVSAAISAYDSVHGTTREIETLNILLEDIQDTNSRLQTTQLSTGKLYSHAPRFPSLVKECDNLVKELRHIMGKLVIREEAPSRTIESGRVAIQSWWKRKDIASIKERLLQVEARLKDAVAQILLKDTHSSIMAELQALRDEGRMHERQTQDAISQLDSIRQDISTLKKMVSEPSLDAKKSIVSGLKHPAEAIMSAESANEHMQHVHRDIDITESKMGGDATADLKTTASSEGKTDATSDEAGYAAQLYEIRKDILQITRQDDNADPKSSSSHSLLLKLNAFTRERDSCVARLKILKSLYCPELRRRIADITQAEPHTLRWLYDPLETSLVNWLASQHGIYWINGLAGSGKSTLMKFVAGHTWTKLALKKWAGTLPLHIASHYFWHHGHSIQRSQVGLFRSLLYQILRTNPGLIPLVCPGSVTRMFEFEEWDMADLKSCFDLLCQLTSLSAKFCFFVDGLDEYEGDESELIDALRLMTSSPHIKVCVSSRPWPEFSKAFGRTCPTLVVQDHTLEDMKTYVKHRLIDSPDFQKLRIRDDSCDEIIPEIAKRAQGVWLWTYLVTHDLKRAVTRSEGVQTLRTILESFPPSLEDYFEQIISRVEPHYQKDMVRIFMMVVEAAQPLPLFVFRFLWDQDRDPDYAIKAAPKSLRLYGEPMDYYKGRPLRIARARLGLQRPREAQDEADSLSYMNTEEQQQFTEFVTEMEDWKTRIHNRCSDLLRVSEDPDGEMFLRFRVSFLHRTVADWLRENFAKRMEQILSNTHSRFNAKTTLCYMILMLLKLIPDPQPHTHPQTQTYPHEDAKSHRDYESAKRNLATSRYINQIITLTDELLCYVYQLEQTESRLSEEDLVNLLDDLDATNADHFKRTANHWTNVRDWPRGLGSDRYSEGGNCDFMALAVQCRLLRYVRSELKAINAPAAKNEEQSPHDRHSPRSLHKKGRPLLDYALRPRRVTPLDLPYHLQPGDWGVEPEMVQLLVDHGADVNARVYLNDGKTVFALFVVSCYEASKLHNRPRTELVHKWYRSMCILLKNGAKLEEISLTNPNGAMTAEDLLLSIFGKAKTADLKELSLAYVPPRPAWLLWALWGYYLLLGRLWWISLAFCGLFTTRYIGKA